MPARTDQAQCTTSRLRNSPVTRGWVKPATAIRQDESITAMERSLALPTSFESAQHIAAAKSLRYPRGISTKACQL